MNDPVQGPHSVMGTALRTESIRAVQEVPLGNRLQHLAQGVVDQLVLERRDSNRPRLTPFPFDADTSVRLTARTFRLHPGVQIPEIFLQVLPVLGTG